MSIIFANDNGWVIDHAMYIDKGHYPYRCHPNQFTSKLVVIETEKAVVVKNITGSKE
eukprot:Ihof_evm4s593 gene=Ihof_evmTU4s593